MFNAGLWELLLLAVVALLVMGPERMPQALAQAGRVLAGLRRSSFALRRQLEQQWGEQGLAEIDELLELAPDRKAGSDYRHSPARKVASDRAPPPADRKPPPDYSQSPDRKPPPD